MTTVKETGIGRDRRGKKQCFMYESSIFGTCRHLRDWIGEMMHVYSFLGLVEF